MSLRGRLTLLYVAATTALFAATLWLSYATYHAGSAVVADRTLRRAAEEAAEIVEGQSPFQLERIRARLDGLSEGNEGLFVNLIAAQGRILYQSDPLLPVLHRGREGPAPADRRLALSTLPWPGRGALRLASLFLPDSGGGVWLEIGLPLPSSLPLYSGWQAYFVGLGFLLLTAALGWTGWLLAGRALAPIERIATVAETVSQGALHERIPHPGRRDELGRLIEVLNGMLDRLERAATQLQQFSANVSHQLKTPLTAMCGELEVALRGATGATQLRSALQNSLAEMEKLSRLVEDLLAFARMDQQKRQAPSALALDVLVREVARKAELLSRGKSLRIQTELRPLLARADSGRLEQALLNIVENAVKNTPPGGRIALGLHESAQGAEIRIADSGPGVPAEALPRLLERGRSPGGTGIGLALARALLESFGARLELSSSRGRGLTVRVLLPLASDRREPG